MSIDVNNYNSNTVEQLRNYLDALGYYTNMRMNKNKLIDKCKEHRNYEQTSYKYDTLHKPWLIRFGEIAPAADAIKFGNLNKRLRSILSLNFLWQKLSMSLPRYQELHPVDLRRNQKEGFWKNWYQNNRFRYVEKTSSYCATRILRGGARLQTVYPRVGSTLVASKLVGNVMQTVRYVCVEVKLLSKGQNKNLPKEIKIAPIRKVDRVPGKCVLLGYFNHDVITDKIGESGEVDRKYTILDPELY